MASKFYFEVRIDALDSTSGGLIRVGAGNSSWATSMGGSSSSFYVTSAVNGNAAAYTSSGLCQFAEASPVAGTACPVAHSGSVIGMAIDTSNGGVWWSVDGVWTSNGGVFNPSTPTFTVGGLTSSNVTGGVYPFIGLNAPMGSSPQVTLVTSGAALKSPPPSGFTAIEP